MNGGGNPYVLDDDVVVTGFSGRFPESQNVEEFKKNLFEGLDMVTDDDRRWTPGIFGLPERSGKIKDLKSFDATFFGVHGKQAHVMDPQLRMLLETTYEAIVDAGMNPNDLRGSRTGVFVGVSSSESDDYFSKTPDQINGYSLTGCCRAMFPNRISFVFDFSGPSYAIDTACSSSLFAFHQAATAIRNGECDSAIVAGCNILLKPTSSLQFHRLSMLSQDGACRAFDADGKGYVRSEAAVSVFLQKSKDARRVYATVVHSKTNTDGNKVLGITYPSGDMQNKLMREIYAESGVSPADVTYVEAHGTGTKVGDPQEVNSIANLFCKGRKAPLLLGSIKSNMGHPEPASGLCAIAKVLIAMNTGVIPANLHFNNPNPDIPCLFDGSVKVVDKPTPWKGGYAAVNSFGFGGANAHVLLRSNPKPKLSPVLETKVPKLVAVSGRTEEAVQMLLDKAKEHEKDDEFIAILHDTYANNIMGHSYRGYTVMGNVDTAEISQLNSSEKRPIWFVFSGMGSQWPGMGKELLSIEPFQRSLQRSAEVLKAEGVDLMNLILNGTAETFENIVSSFVSIAAIQVALVDLLSYLGIHPDGIIGHSVGEVGCAYADGTFTPEQTVLAAYWRGRSLQDSKLPSGAMAAVGLSWDDVKTRCPPDVYPACNNSSDSVTVSGPVNAIVKFIEEMKEEGIFAKRVNSSGMAFHSKYIAAAGQNLRVALERIIPNPKQRSHRWISTSIPEEAWNTPLAQLSSAAYHVNNLLSPVLFQHGLAHVPENAIAIEIAPHCLLQAILRRSLGPGAVNIGLHKRDHSNNVGFLLDSLGKLYNAGAQLKVSKLYPSISYPVGNGTPMLSSLVKWDHSTEYEVADFKSSSASTGETAVTVDLSKDDAYLAGHVIDGRILFPATGYLVMAWKILAKLRNTDFEQMPVVFENVQFLRATIMPKDAPVKFMINIFTGTGDFEISENGSVAVTGKISVPENIDKVMLKLPEPSVPNQPEFKELNKNDVYKDLRLRGYGYEGCFQGIKSTMNRGGIGKLTWNDWISFMDTMLQFAIFEKPRALYVPVRMQFAAINPELHMQYVQRTKDEGIPVYSYSNIDVIKSGGIEIRKMKPTLAPKKQHNQTPTIEKFVFTPYISTQPLAQNPDTAKLYALSTLIQITKENLKGLKLKVVEAAGDRFADELLIPLVQSILYRECMYSSEQILATTKPEAYSGMAGSQTSIVQRDCTIEPIAKNAHVVMAANVMTAANTKTILKNLVDSLKTGGFLLLEEASGQVDENTLKEFDLILVAKQVIFGKAYFLLKQREEKSNDPIVVEITEKKFHWLEAGKAALRKSVTDNQDVLFVCQGDESSGIIGFMNCIRREDGGGNAIFVFVQDKNAAKFSLKEKIYAEQLDKQLMANVLKGGVWGSYRHYVLDQQNGEISSLQVEHAYINALYRGDLSSLRWIESPLSYYEQEKSSNLEFCYVYYAPLNFRDVMLSTGKLPPDALPGNLASQDCIMGLEFSGRDSKGQRVMAMVPARGLATTVAADSGFMWKVPEKWTLEEASTIPVAYSTSYYALFVRGRLRPGESVLIHAGSGGVGQASIAIALHAGCKVFTTVGTQEKRNFLKKMFPQLTDRDIGNSRDSSFEQLILNETNGRGVDVVLNSLSEEKLQASIRCLAVGGRFLEIGKFDLSNDAPLGMSVFLKNTTFHGILLDAITEGDSPDRREVVRLVQEGINNGAVRPLPATVFSEQQLEQSFRFMATGKHIGKVVLKIRNEEKQKVAQPSVKTVTAIPRTYMNPNKSYVLIGGLGGFALELADWMINRGAKHIVLTSRSGIRDGFQAMCIRRWREMGVNVVVSTTDVVTMAGARKLITDTNKIAPVGGIFNLAAVLRDNTFAELTEEDYKISTMPKIDATKCLDAVSRELCSALDYFVVFSSITSGRGNIGQTNYGFANSAMERIVEQRQRNGLPGLAIQWGAVGDVGMIIDLLKGSNDTAVSGTVPQRIQSCLNTIDVLLQQPHPVLTSYVVQDKCANMESANQVSLPQTIANILGIKKLESINPNLTLADLGMDSLMGTEIKQTLERNYDVVLSAQDIRNLTFEKLSAFGSDSKPAAAAATKTDAPGAAASPTAHANRDSTADFLYQFEDMEIVPTQPIVSLKTKGSNGTPVFFVHAIEGMISPLKTIAKELDRPVWGFQCVPNAPLSSITDLAKFYIQEMRQIQKKGPYRIVGYSFGACVGFEMALQLEKSGEQTVLTLIDGSPEFVHLHATMISMQTGQADQGVISDSFRKSVSYFAIQFNTKLNFVQVYKSLKETTNDEETLDKMVQLINHPQLKAADLKTAATLFSKKLHAGYYYKPNALYSGEVVLIKVKDSFVDLKKDYGLAEICKKQIRIEELSENHRSLLKGQAACTIAKLIRT